MVLRKRLPGWQVPVSKNACLMLRSLNIVEKDRGRKEERGQATEIQLGCGSESPLHFRTEYYT
jgi:hypothetical protein